MDIYDFLIVKKRGSAYKQQQIKKFSLYNVPLDLNKKVRGNSRIWGDISTENQKIVIDKIISLGSRLHLSYRDIAYALLLCYAESGFNPDAAAGTTSASGLAQYTEDTMKSFSSRAKKYLLQKNLTMHPQNVFDVDIGVYGVIAAYLFNKDLATQWIKPNNSPKFWQTIYMLHHDGPGYYTDERGKLRAQKGDWKADAIKTYNQRILPKLDDLELLLKNSTAAVKVQLEDYNGQPIQNKEYIAAVPARKTTESTPGKLSTDRKVAQKSYNVVHGKTDANGFTKELLAGIGCELIILLCSNHSKKLGKAVSEEKYKQHIVKKGETLSKIAKENNTTVAEIVKANKIKNPNQIITGQNLVIKKKYLRHKPSGSAMKEILNKAGLSDYSKDSIIYARNHIVKPSGSTSASSGHKIENTVTLRTSTSADFVNKKNKEFKKKEINDTTKEGSSKIVHSQYPGKAVIYTYQDFDYKDYEEPKKGYTVFYDHMGNKLFSFVSGSRAVRGSRKGAEGPMIKKFVKIEGGFRSYRHNYDPAGYGTTRILSTDDRGRWIHGGGSKLPHPYAEKQGWVPTKGCTRAQNGDLEKFAEIIREFRRKYPNIQIMMIRDQKEENRKRYPR